MKKTILTLGICFISLLSIQAQSSTSTSNPPAPTLDQKVDKLLSTLTSTCNLTPAQVTKARPIVEETIKARMANKQKYGSDKTQLRAANQATLAAENVKMNAILNADQQAKLSAFEKSKEEAAQKRQSAQQ
jgi:hypothetical protein